MKLEERIFSIKTDKEFEEISLEVFDYQFKNNEVYKEFCSYLKKNPANVHSVYDIPFLPIEFFKSKRIFCGNNTEQQIFTSSGTIGSSTSKHFVKDISVYEKSFRKGFELFYGKPSEYVILALLPSYLERSGSSLIYMVEDLIKQSNNTNSGFYLYELDKLAEILDNLDKKGQKTLLIGVSFALLDLTEKHQFQLKNTIVMETGGMKGRRKELIREELHRILCDGFGTQQIHSEYGMTELLSQGYSSGKGIFKTVPWLKILIRDTNDALSFLPNGKSGGVNIIDLANIHSCSFIATQDLGKVYNDNTFEILGRFDNADIRGCNLLVM
ncbi:acyltransferase [Capnocytophaga cynodegmi]|uniref:Acyl-protein synthetase n=1 Tax=Capnocytophaga cynodegmi TaxID=28189 RepID=A0A0B7HJC3_9FLAO|nr:acyltransferase [Capnocytophaga cynodegmi]CEN38719.1 Acyl-protein synthetase [Capnocytophaga cynodegmi]